MTWSIAHQGTFSESTNTEHSYWDYHFMTFLPTKGWTVTKGAPASATAGEFTSPGSVYQVEKAFTMPDGSTQTVRIIHYFRWSSSLYSAYTWDGVDFTNNHTFRLYFSSMSGFWQTASTAEGYWLVSDESEDAWMLLLGGRMMSTSFPVDGWVVDFDLAYHHSHANSNNGYAVNLNSQALYAGMVNSFSSNAYVMTNSWLMGIGAGTASTYSINTLTDTFLRINGSQSGGAVIQAQSPSSVLLNGNYYIDLYPGSVIGLMLDTDQFDAGIL